MIKGEIRRELRWVEIAPFLLPGSYENDELQKKADVLILRMAEICDDYNDYLCQQL